MPRKAEDLERDIERKRHEIDDDITRLREELLNRMDWKWQVRTRPFAALAAALVFGVFAGLVITR